MDNSKVKSNRIYGIRGIRVKNGNLNSGFDNRPKSLADGTFYNSDVSTKYLDRDFFKKTGNNVLIKKYLKLDKDGNIYSATQQEIIEDKVKGNDEDRIVNIINEFPDVQNYGAALTGNINFGITGAVQYGIGVNVLEESNIIVGDIISPYGTGNNKKNKKKNDSDEATEEGKNSATNIGKSIFVDNALYVQDFRVEPYSINSLKEVYGDKLNGYTEEAYALFKKAVLFSASLINTRTKKDCYDEFAIFINLKDDSIYTINDLSGLLKISEDDKKIIIDLEDLGILDKIKDVESIELYDSNSCNFKNIPQKAIIKDRYEELYEKSK